MVRQIKSKAFFGLFLALVCGYHVSCGHSVSAESEIPSSTRDIEFTYRIVVRDIPRDAQTLRIWLPVPRNDNSQLIDDLQIESPVSFLEVNDSEYGNRMLYCELLSDIPDSLPITMTFRVHRSEAVPFVPEDTGSTFQKELHRFLSADALVPIGGAVAREADSVAGELSTPMSKAQALYHHVVGSMRYDKSGTGWGNGDAIFACEERRGNCTDIHSLLIGLARAQDIPARFVIGFPIPTDEQEGSIAGYHCWADLYLAGEGWVPVDASEAIKHPKRTNYYFGRLDEDRVAFTIGRDIRLPGISESIVSNYFIYPRVRIDNRDYANVGREFRFRTVDVPVTRGSIILPSSGRFSSTK